MMALEHLCSGCGRTFVRFNTLQRLCGLCNINARPEKKRKPLKKIGKVGRRLIATRNEWITNNPPDPSGFYTCYICLQPVHIDQLNVEHVKSKARRPDLRYDQNNLKPSCSSCNEAKGSKSN